MKSLKLTGIILLVILTTFAMSTGAWAKKGGKPGGGGGTDTGHVSMEVTGANELDFVVDAFQDCEERLASDDTSFLCNKRGVTHYINLGDFFMNRAYPNGSSARDCFGEDPGAGRFAVTIGVAVNRDGSAEAVLRFHAFENDGETDVLYVLVVTDPDGWSGPFPPAVEDTTTMGVLQGKSIRWELRTSNKRQERDACVDSGTFIDGSDFIKVDFTRID